MARSRRRRAGERASERSVWWGWGGSQSPQRNYLGGSPTELRRLGGGPRLQRAPGAAGLAGWLACGVGWGRDRRGPAGQGDVAVTGSYVRWGKEGPVWSTRGERGPAQDVLREVALKMR